MHLLPCSDGHATLQRKFATVLRDLCSSLFLLGTDRLHPVATGWGVSKALCHFPQKASTVSGTANHGAGKTNSLDVVLPLCLNHDSWSCLFKILVKTVASKAMPVSCGRRLSAPPTQLKALLQLRAVIQWAMHAQPNKTVDIRDIRDFPWLLQALWCLLQALWCHMPPRTFA